MCLGVWGKERQMNTTSGLVIFDASGYAVGVVWKTNDGLWRGKRIPPFDTVIAPSDLFSTETEAVKWLQERCDLWPEMY